VVGCLPFIPEEGTDLIYEGITTVDDNIPYSLDIASEGTDLIYEGITTVTDDLCGVVS
jgi:hypothetical protein